MNGNRLRIALLEIRQRTKGKAEDLAHSDLYGFLTTEPNDVVAPIHPKAMPVILTNPEDIETWLTAPAEEALKLQRPLPTGALKIVGKDSKKDCEERNSSRCCALGLGWRRKMALVPIPLYIICKCSKR